jgi:exosome complex component RRP40
MHQVNSLVFARVSLAHKDMEPELECFDAQTRKAEGFGELKGGFLVRCSLKMSRKCVISFTNCSGSRRVS